MQPILSINRMHASICFYSYKMLEWGRSDVTFEQGSQLVRLNTGVKFLIQLLFFVWFWPWVLGFKKNMIDTYFWLRCSQFIHFSIEDFAKDYLRTYIRRRVTSNFSHFKILCKEKEIELKMCACDLYSECLHSFELVTYCTVTVTDFGSSSYTSSASLYYFVSFIVSNWEHSMSLSRSFF